MFIVNCPFNIHVQCFTTNTVDSSKCFPVKNGCICTRHSNW